jgi:hypothetical protein
MVEDFWSYGWTQTGTSWKYSRAGITPSRLLSPKDLFHPSKHEAYPV